MSHEVETMMYAGATPWQGLGTYVGDEPLTSEDAIIQAGLDCTVSKRELFAFNESSGAIPVEAHSAIVRDTDDKVLGVVGKNYTPIQNLDAFGFMDSLVDESLMRYHTAGSLSGGRRVWMLGKVGSSEIIPNDHVDHYLFLYNGFDGKTSLRCLWTDVRVVCANTARAALDRGEKTGVSVRHTRNAMDNMREAQKVLGLAREAFDDSANFMRQLADTPMPTTDWVDFCIALVPEPATDEDGEISKRARTRVDNRRRDLTGLFVGGTGTNIPGVGGTAWAAYNALTEYASFHRTTRGSQDKRFESLLLGTGNDFIQRGTDILRDIAA